MQQSMMISIELLIFPLHSSMKNTSWGILHREKYYVYRNNRASCKFYTTGNRINRLYERDTLPSQTPVDGLTSKKERNYNKKKKEEKKKDT